MYLYLLVYSNDMVLWCLVINTVSKLMLFYETTKLFKRKIKKNFTFTPYYIYKAHFFASFLSTSYINKVPRHCRLSTDAYRAYQPNSAYWPNGSLLHINLLATNDVETLLESVHLLTCHVVNSLSCCWLSFDFVDCCFWVTRNKSCVRHVND